LFTAEQKPRLIVCPKDVSEVQATINYARENNIPLVVKGGGHGFASQLEGGITVDLRNFKVCTSTNITHAFHNTAPLQFTLSSLCRTYP
jgi:FAD/FMN-containing dehydrogenase